MQTCLAARKGTVFKYSELQSALYLQIGKSHMFPRLQQTLAVLWQPAGNPEQVGKAATQNLAGAGFLLEDWLGWVWLLNAAWAEGLHRRQGSVLRHQTDPNLKPGLQLGNTGPIFYELSSLPLFMGMTALL